ncbi:MAG: (2Fe-2S)-binding protein [Clostridia bacterium]|nr:(2Fe-2S)-binding protein [Clostridia bacterium]
MKENYTVCHCKQVTYAQIADALDSHKRFDSVLEAFEDVQHVTHCSTGCGGCHQKIMDIISDLMMGY